MAFSINKYYFIFGFLFCILTLLLSYVFYKSHLRSNIENKLFDVRTRLSVLLYPNSDFTQDIVVVGINDDAVKFFEHSDVKILSAYSFIKISKILLSHNPKILVIFLYPPYNDPNLSELAELAQSNENMYIALFGINRRVTKWPFLLHKAHNKLFSANLETYFVAEVARSLPFLSYDNPERSFYLLPNIAQKLQPKIDFLRVFKTSYIKHDIGDEKSLHFMLNYIHPSKITIMNLMDIINMPTQANLNNKIVFVGYTSFINTTYFKTFTNTPWQYDGADIKKGVPQVVINAIGLQNLLSHRWLKPTHDFIVVLQTILVTLFSYFIWYLSAEYAVILFLSGWGIILVIHTALFAFLNIYIPLADAALYASLATIIGGIQRLQLEGKERIKAITTAQMYQEINKLHDNFLKNLGHELSNINSVIIDKLHLHEVSIKQEKHDLYEDYSKLLNSAKQLEDFLDGIHFATQDVLLTHRKTSFKFINLRYLVNFTLSKFDIKIQENSIRIHVDIPVNVIIKTDPFFLEQIIYNLISNAIKYSPPGGNIYISYIKQSKNSCSIAIKDEGVGIPQHLHDKIFEKFYRIKDDVTYRTKGYGLGLYLCKYFASFINAQISLESAPNQGATFYINFKKIKIHD